MNLLYNLVIWVGAMFLRLIALFPSYIIPDGKLKRFARGQQTTLQDIQVADLKSLKSGCIWIHAASLGEYGVVRPIIKRLKAEKKCTIVLTFFSSTGYDALHENHSDVDYVFYLPWDSVTNVRTFLDLVSPQKAIFVISEYWANYLRELKARNIPTYLVSAIITRKSPFFRWYGGLYRSLLGTYTHFMVLNESSKANLEYLGYTNVTMTGDPLFDNVIAVSKTPYTNPVVERFVNNDKVFIAGSISDDKDMRLICALANRHRDVRFIIVPHEVNKEMLNGLKSNLKGKSLCYSECNSDVNWEDTQVLIIDFVGALAYLYRYASWAYVGGGFTPYLHSIIEATVYGLPVAFGPMIHRKVTPNELVNLKIGTIVSSEEEIIKWFEDLKDNSEELESIRQKAWNYTKQNGGATLHILNLMQLS